MGHRSRDRRLSRRVPTQAPLSLGVALRPVVRVVVAPSPVRRSLLGDRRFFHPAGVLRPAAALNRSARRLVPARKAKPSRLSLASRIGFAVPKQVMVCVRRKSRREVIFAKSLGGRGSRSKKHFNIWSAVSC